MRLPSIRSYFQRFLFLKCGRWLDDTWMLCRVFKQVLFRSDLSSNQNLIYWSFSQSCAIRNGHCWQIFSRGCSVANNQDLALLPLESIWGTHRGRGFIWVASESGGELLAEVYGDLWLLPQAFIASSSVGSPGRPMVSINQCRGSGRWAHWTHCSLRFVIETNGVTEHSTSRWQTKARGGKKPRGKDSCSVNGIRTSTWPSAAKKIYGSLGFVLLAPIKFLSFWSAVIKFWHKETFELDPRTIIFATAVLKPKLQGGGFQAHSFFFFIFVLLFYALQ